MAFLSLVFGLVFGSVGNGVHCLGRARQAFYNYTTPAVSSSLKHQTFLISSLWSNDVSYIAQLYIFCG